MIKFDKNILNIGDYDALEKANEKESKKWLSKHKRGAFLSSAMTHFTLGEGKDAKEFERLQKTGLGWVKTAEYTGNNRGDDYYLVTDKGVALMSVQYNEGLPHLYLEFFIEVLGGMTKIETEEDKKDFADLSDGLIDSLARDPALLKHIPQCIWEMENFDEKLIKKCQKFNTIKKAMKAIESRREIEEENEM